MRILVGALLGHLALAGACSPARGSVESPEPAIREEPVTIGRLPSFAAPRAKPRSKGPVSWTPECDEGAEERQFTPFECSSTCTGHEALVRYCAEGRWNSKVLEADCTLCPNALPKTLAACRLEHATIAPSEHSSTDGCKLELSCGKNRLMSECDGENDGTNTSLCDCKMNGAEVRAVSNPVRGEAPGACLAAAEKCLAQSRR